jgi:phage baseplate assembly protein W
MAKEFLGVGWKFPIQLNTNGEFKLSKYEEDIKEAILIILKTAPGERVMQPEFGCGIYKYIFSTINITNLMLMEEEVKKALMFYEPRIEVEKVHAIPNSDNNETQVLISIDYTIISTNDRQNLVYPFYLQEGG